MRLGRVGVRTRIYAGFGALVALSLVIAGVGWFGLSGVNVQVGLSDQVVGNLVRALRVTHALEAMRRAETRYRLDMNAAAINEDRDLRKQVDTLLEAAGKVTLSSERLQIYKAVREANLLHATAVEQYVMLRNDAAKLTAQSSSTGDTLMAAADRLVDGTLANGNAVLIAAALNVRKAAVAIRTESIAMRNEAVSVDVAVFERASDDGLAALATLARTSDPASGALVQPLSEAFRAYYADAARFAEMKRQHTALYEELVRPQIAAMQQQIATALVSLQKGYDDFVTGAEDTAAAATLMQETASGVVLLLGLGLAMLVGRSIVRPIAGMTAAMTKLAAGDRMVEIPSQDATDEIGAMARAVGVFRENAIANDRLAAEQAVMREAKDRRQAATDRHTQDFGTAASGAMATLVSSAEHMRVAALAVADAAKRTRESASNTAEGASELARNLAAVAAAAEEMSASIAEIATQVTHVTSAVRETVDRATITDTKVASLAEAGRRIGDVVRMITNIAEQTNLLALNATIEAARAGEAGKGFAVVAGEVKALAAQTARATEEIGTQIVAIRDSTSEAVEAVRDVSAAIGKIDAVATAIAAAVEEQAIATREIAASVQAVTTSTEDATRAMQEVSAIAVDSDTSGAAVLLAAEGVGKTADTLRREVNFFLEAIANTEEANRRRYERISGAGQHAILTASGRQESVTIMDISRGGVAFASKWSAPAGTEVQITLPGSDAQVAARVVRESGGVLALSFRQDEAAMVRVDRALDVIAEKTLAKAA